MKFRKGIRRYWHWMLLAYIIRIDFFLILMIKCCACQPTTPQCSRHIVGALWEPFPSMGTEKD